MKIAVVGSRAWPYPDVVRIWMQKLAAKHPNATVVSGGAKGVDTIAAVAAQREGLTVQVFEAQWDVYGKSAGFKRNVQIVEAADVVVAFWDGFSKGTKHSLDLAVAANKPVYVMGATGRLREYTGA